MIKGMQLPLLDLGMSAYKSMVLMIAFYDKTNLNEGIIIKKRLAF